MLTLTVHPVPADTLRAGLLRRDEIAIPLGAAASSQAATGPAATGPADGPEAPADEAGEVLARLDRADAEVLEALGCDPGRRLTRARATGRAGEVVSWEPERERPSRVHLVGVGDASPDALRRAGAALGKALDGRPAAALLPDACDADGVRAFAEGLLLASYRPPRRGLAARSGRPGRVALGVPDGLQPAVTAATVTAAAVDRARTLAATPSNIKSPAWLATRATAVARDASLTVEQWQPDRLAAEGFGGLLAVGAASAQGPRLIRLDHRPAGARRHVALVGKGITFDSGGLSLKPADAMAGMTTDMSGAAAVLAVLGALAERAVPVAVTGILALAENMPGAAAMRPGDVITHRGGRTTEVLNTDAEGRLVLADALDYTADVVRPDVVVDIATLTGAATLALGRGTGALLTPDDGLAAALLAAAAAGGERLWRLPLVTDYAAALDSDVADAANVSRDPHVGGGAITAALFLQPFAGGIPWAHLDIAGPARSPVARDDVPKGATGYGTRLLLRWLEAGAPA